MKLKFKVQPYQTNAVNDVVDCFEGQPMSSGLTYRIDPGSKVQAIPPDVLRREDMEDRTHRKVNLPSWNQERLEKSPGRLPAQKDNAYNKPTTGWLTGGNGDPI